ncbi:(2Fe-2S)-binding protein [Streptomyces cellulosae]|uniref:(2Fe-2S)-binding protein n=1 Tax=Streptomyces cellulosae TaxID=1968 RepID=A0ABW6JCW8_STRCE|nr:(2Fe-2S)-binding protein [Streptomyces sp. AC04842]GHE44951.1 carbon-monoxide dehydrogenase small subunit [Streptomyces cellulosae]
MTTSTGSKYGTGQRTVTVRVNGRDVTREVSTRTTLADFLRDDLDLVSVHLGCEHGVCGCCTILLDGHSVRSCLMLAVQADGHAVETVESLSGNPAELHPIQESFAEEQGLQCGFCTPAMVLRTKEIIETGRELTDAEVRHEISGILCRCTGYQNIVNAVQSASAKLRCGAAGAGCGAAATDDSTGGRH